MKRSGAALIIVLIALSLVGVMTAALTWQSLAQRRFLRQREHQMEAYWLAEAGIEQAAGRLLADAEFRAETLKLEPETEVRIQVKAGKDGAYHVVSEARVALDSPELVVRTAERTFRLAKGGEKRALKAE